MQRELSSFPLPPAHRTKLHSAGFVTVDDLEGVKPSELSKELNITPEESLELLRVIRGDTSSAAPSSLTVQASTSAVPPGELKGKPTASASPHHAESRTVTALDMLQDEHSHQSIVTFSEQLDGILGGGVPLTKITEFCGAPGVGKTQISMQLAVDVQIPECFGGLGGEAFYVDTEGSLIVDRLRDIADATVSHCEQIARLDNSPEQLEVLKCFTVESILEGVHYFRCHDYVELVALVHLLPELLKQQPRVRLIVVDSIAFHFRHDFEDFSLRTRLLNGMAQSFIKMATLNKMAIVLTNQMTTKVSGGSGQLVPALGESWGHAATLRIILYWHQQQRHALLYKSPSRGEASVPYQITVGGVRDVTIVTGSGDMPPQPLDGDKEQHSRKRIRLE